MNLLGKPLREWVQAGTGLRTVSGPEIPDEPGEMVVLSLNGGLDPIAEGMIDTPGIQARVLGPQDDYDRAEEMAQLVDVFLMTAHHAVVGNTTVLSVSRTGGPPDPEAPDNARRTAFVCNYLARVTSAF